MHLAILVLTHITMPFVLLSRLLSPSMTYISRDITLFPWKCNKSGADIGSTVNHCECRDKPHTTIFHHYTYTEHRLYHTVHITHHTTPNARTHKGLLHRLTTTTYTITTQCCLPHHTTHKQHTLNST